MHNELVEDGDTKHLNIYSAQNKRKPKKKGTYACHPKKGSKAMKAKTYKKTMKCVTKFHLKKSMK